MGRGKVDWQLTNKKTATGIKPCPFFLPADIPTFNHRPAPTKHELQIGKAAFKVQRGVKKSKATALDVIMPPLRAAAKSCAVG